MNYEEMIEATENAERTLRSADSATRKLVPFIAGRLKKAQWESDYGHWKYIEALKQLKRELRDFNAVTGKWKD